MFDQLLHTFLQVVETKSFSAAAKQLFLTPNAVKKRIEALEQQTGIQLFLRSNRGTVLTAAGESLYTDLLVLDQQYSAALSKARYLQDPPKKILAIGIMSTFADAFLTTPWFDIRKKLRSQSLQLVHYGNTPSDFEDLFREVGAVTHLCVDVYEEERAHKYRLSARKVSSFGLCIGIPDTMEPPRSPSPSFADLANCTLAIPREGRSQTFDAARRLFLQQTPSGRIVDLEEYTVRSVNDCYMNDCCILAPQGMLDHYPFYTVLPLQEALQIEFGLYYKKKDEHFIRDFLNSITTPSISHP